MKRLYKAILLMMALLVLPLATGADAGPYINEIFCINSAVEGGTAKAGQPFVLKVSLKSDALVETKGTLALREVGEGRTNKYFEGGQDQEFDLKAGEAKDFYFELKANENLGNTSYPLTLSIKTKDLEIVDRVHVGVVSDTSTVLPAEPDGETGKIDVMLGLKELPADIKKELLEKPKQEPKDEPKKDDKKDDDKTPSKDIQDPGGDTLNINSGPSINMGGGGSGGFDLSGSVDTGTSGGGSSSNPDVKNKPKLIIDKYSFEPQYPLAGEDFKMNLSFFNTNADKGVRNIKIFLTSNDTPANQGNGAGAAAGSSVFTPVGSSNTFYIDYIEPKGTVNKSVVLTTAPTIASKNYTLIANFEYEDKDGNEYVAQELIGIPITQESKLTTSKVTVMGEAYIDMPVDGEIQFYNTGKDTLYNLMVSVEGNFKDASMEEYVGNFQSGDSTSYMFNVTPSEPGVQKGKIIFKYEDAIGETRTIEEEFDLSVSSEAFMDPEMEAPMEDAPMEVGPSVSPLVLGLGTLVLALILGLFAKRKRDKNKEEDLTIDED